MDTVVDAQTLALSLAVVSLVAAARKHAPRIDGWMVLALALLVSALVVVSGDPTAPIVHLVSRTALVFGCAVGGNAWAEKIAREAAPKALNADSVVVVKNTMPELPRIEQTPTDPEFKS